MRAPSAAAAAKQKPRAWRPAITSSSTPAKGSRRLRTPQCITTTSPSRVLLDGAAGECGIGMGGAVQLVAPEAVGGPALVAQPAGARPWPGRSAWSMPPGARQSGSTRASGAICLQPGDRPRQFGAERRRWSSTSAPRPWRGVAHLAGRRVAAEIPVAPGMAGEGMALGGAGAPEGRPAIVQGAVAADSVGSSARNSVARTAALAQDRGDLLGLPRPAGIDGQVDGAAAGGRRLGPGCDGQRGAGRRAAGGGSSVRRSGASRRRPRSADGRRPAGLPGGAAPPARASGAAGSAAAIRGQALGAGAGRPAPRQAAGGKGVAPRLDEDAMRGAADRDGLRLPGRRIDDRQPAGPAQGHPEPPSRVEGDAVRPARDVPMRGGDSSVSPSSTVMRLSTRLLTYSARPSGAGKTVCAPRPSEDGALHLAVRRVHHGDMVRAHDADQQLAVVPDDAGRLRPDLGGPERLAVTRSIAISRRTPCRVTKASGCPA